MTRRGSALAEGDDPGALAPLEFPAGSMGPKVQAAIEFVNGSGRLAAIGALSEAVELLAGTAGTRITRETEDIEWWD